MVQYAALVLMMRLQTARLSMFMICLPTVGSQVPAWFERSARAYLLLVLQAARSKNDIGIWLRQYSSYWITLGCSR